MTNNNIVISDAHARRIRKFLRQNPSYLKWGKARLATKFECAEVTIGYIVNSLKKVKRDYLRNF